MSGAIVTQSGDIRRFQVTIPTLATGARIIDLIGLPESGVGYFGFRILGVKADGTQRALIQLASPRPGAEIDANDFTLHGEAVIAGDDYYEPADGDLFSYVRAPGGDTVAVVVVYVR